MRRNSWGQWTKLARIALRHRLDVLLPQEKIPNAIIRGCLTIARACLPAPQAGDGERLRDALLDLGPVYIKFGQLLSTRKDLFATEITDALATLQDQVPPIENLDVHNYVSRSLNIPWQQEFQDIDATPLAAASIAQVHRARLLDGTEVVIKLVRPDIEPTIAADMDWLRRVADLVHQRLPEAYRFHLPNLVRDHAAVLLKELDLFAEARNQIQLRRNFAESDLLYVPRVYAKYSREDLLVMEYVDGVPISDIQTFNQRGVDLEKLAYKGVETFFTQVFVHNFFHADMHPGNILVDINDPTNPRYIALDCAIIGSLTPADQAFLARNLVAFFNRDFATVAELFWTNGWIPADQDPAEFAAVIETVCGPIFDKPLAEISFADFVVELFKAAGQFEMELQPQLALLQKTLLYIEGLGRQIYPQLDLWQTAKPFMETWVAEQFNPLTAFIAWLEQGLKRGQWVSQFEHSEAAMQLRRTTAVQTRQLRALEQRLDQQSRRQRRSLIGVVLVGMVIWLV